MPSVRSKKGAVQVRSIRGQLVYLNDRLTEIRCDAAEREAAEHR